MSWYRSSRVIGKQSFANCFPLGRPGFDTNVFSPYAESAASRRVSTHVPRAGSPSFSPPYPVRAGSPRPGSPPGSPGASAYSDAAMSDEEDLQSIAESSISQANGGPRALVIWRKVGRSSAFSSSPVKPKLKPSLF